MVTQPENLPLNANRNVYPPQEIRLSGMGKLCSGLLGVAERGIPITEGGLHKYISLSRVPQRRGVQIGNLRPIVNLRGGVQKMRIRATIIHLFTNL
jgi:hypothetical protein